jgi:ABC-2 type transport system ATP-binding protein
MKQRLGVARCLMHNPELLLLDEPLSGTTSPTARELGQIFRELTDLGKTVILTAGGRQGVPSTCTHAGLLEGGGVVRQGLFDELELPAETATLEVRILDPGDLAIARDALERTPGCGPVLVRGDHRLIVRFGGAQADLPKLLAALAAENVSVIGFTLEGDSIAAPGGPVARGPGTPGGPPTGER